MFVGLRRGLRTASKYQVAAVLPADARPLAIANLNAIVEGVKFSDEQIKAILDEVFKAYGEFIDGKKGLTYDGLLRTYDAGDRF
ncbi:hypothetical protein RHSIM_Rhsim06G0014000 [Rhododendron simsii]|uniref:Uncharacterized protein n=1 Tax=Rhododendron simsii TaxID=118357 RepID=A0A834GVX6_RHOSS|nr:hypothetical protein RHSIM_Rhsim06G0014000 [Rhododendron simsii]